MDETQGSSDCIHRSRSREYVNELSALEDRLALLLESLESLVPVLGFDHSLIHLILNLLPRIRHSLQASPHTDRTTLANLLRKSHSLTQSSLPRLLENIAPGALILGHNLDQTVRDTEKIGLWGGDAAARQDEVTGAREADQSWEAVGAASAGDDAQTGLGKTDGGVGGEDAEMCR